MVFISARKLGLVIALLGPAGAVLAAPLAACPSQHREGKLSGQLDGASMFDGPPAKRVDLMPDFATLEWDLSAPQKRARAQKDALYLVCKYKGLKATVTVKLPYDATFCKAEGVKNSMVVSCSAASKSTDAT
jgi:hypothetical protein